MHRVSHTAPTGAPSSGTLTVATLRLGCWGVTPPVAIYRATSSRASGPEPDTVTVSSSMVRVIPT